MAMQEIRTELNKLLETCEDNELKVLLDFVQEFKNGTAADQGLAAVRDLGTILREDKNLLQRLNG